MIFLTLAMLRHRRGPALAVALAMAFLVASAVAGPAYLTAADRALVADEWAGAAVSERIIQAAAVVQLDNARDRGFENTDRLGPVAAGFTAVFSAETDINLVRGDAIANPRLVFRDGVCGHLRLRSGRCPQSTGEVVLGTETANRLGLHVGQTLPTRPAVPDPTEGLVPDVSSPYFTLQVVGLYQVRDPAELYWAAQDYFATDIGVRTVSEPVFTARGTLDALLHHKERQYVDYLLDPAAIRVDRLAALKEQVRQIELRSTAAGGLGGSHIDRLADRIQQNRSVLRVVLPLAAVPLLVLGWLLLYFAVGYTAGARRTEAGLAKLRGVPALRRWWIANGESLAAIGVGAPLGYLLGVSIVDIVATRLFLPGAAPPALALVPWRYPLAVLVAALLAAGLANRRQLTGSVVDLLRQVPARVARWRGIALEMVVLVLGGAAVVQLHGGQGQLRGVLLAAPGLVMLAVALLGARLVVPAAARWGARSVRRGRLGRGLGALWLARRPGAAALLVLLVLAIAELTFAAGTASVAGAARANRVRVEVGASRVLSLAPVPRGQLLSAVRRVDPDGRFAMAVTTVRGASDADPPILAVDSSRLARVATWPTGGGLSAARVAALIHPAAPGFLLVPSQEISLDVTAGPVDPAAALHIMAKLVTVDGSGSGVADFGDLRSGRHTYLGNANVCLGGCRLAELSVDSSTGRTFTVRLVLHQLASTEPTGTIPAGPLAAGFDQPGRWRGPLVESGRATARLSSGADGLRVELDGDGTGVDGRLLPADTAYPLPVVSTAALPRRFLGTLGADPPPMVSVGRVPAVPGLGDHGLLVDLEYATRIAADTADADDPQVWLNNSAPPDIERRLVRAGLAVRGSLSEAARLRYYDRQGPAAGVGFHRLAGGIGLLLGLGGLGLTAAVDRRRGRDLRVLRVQGVPAGTLARAHLCTYGTLAVAAVLLGPVAAAVAWWATGAAIPIFADQRLVVAPPRWPDGPRLLPYWGGAGLVLLAAAVVFAYRLHRAIEEDQ